MTDEIAPQWNPRDMADQVRDKIRLQVTELIPPEVWKKVVEDEVIKFTTVTTRRHGSYSNHNEEVRPGIEPMIAAALQEAAKEYIEEELKGLVRPRIDAWIQEYIAANWEDMLKTMLFNAMAGIVTNAQVNVITPGDPRGDPSSHLYDPTFIPAHAY